MYRSNTYDEDFSRDMQHLIARKTYLLELIENEDEPMSIEEASLQLGISQKPFVVFQNSETQKVNVLFKREDGHHGLIEPNF